MKTCYIIGAGDFFGNFSPESDDLVIAADGGYDTLRSLDKRYDILLGDMDSVKNNVSEKEKILFPIEKDETDMFLAYKEGKKRGYTDFRLYGGVGGRIDHTFANICLLIYGKRRGHSIVLIDEGMKISAIKNESVTLMPDECRSFSLLAFDGVANGVTIKGAKYDGESITLSPEFPLGVSNSLVGRPCKITVTDGELILMVSE